MTDVDYAGPEGPTPGEDPIDFVQRRASTNFRLAMDEDPEEAARAHEISKVTGTPASIVNTDVEHYENEGRARLSNGLILKNKYLQQYLNDRMAAQLSHDDIGPLDQASQSIDKLNNSTALKQWLEAKEFSQTTTVLVLLVHQ